VTESNFPACLALTLAQECPKPGDWGNAANFSHTPGDAGGATMCGITQREYDAWNKAHGVPTGDVRAISRGTGTVLYHTSYWLPRCPSLPMGLDLQAFDAAVNEGSHGGLVILQDALGVAPDGVWGPVTAAAVRAGDVAGVVQRFTLCRLAAYERIVRANPGDAKFLPDWTRRAHEIGASALAMAQGRTGAATVVVGLAGAGATAMVTAATAVAKPAAPAPATPSSFGKLATDVLNSQNESPLQRVEDLLETLLR
jgi:lysozyme family protein